MRDGRWKKSRSGGWLLAGPPDARLGESLRLVSRDGRAQAVEVVGVVWRGVEDSLLVPGAKIALDNQGQEG